MSRQEETRRFLKTPLPQDVLAGITGNAPDELKELPLKWLAIFKNKGTGFAGSIANRIRVTDVSVVPSPDDPLKMESVVTSEIEVTLDMCSERGVVDEGCIVYLIDESSTTAMIVMQAYEDENGTAGVSQTINTFFHSSGLLYNFAYYQSLLGQWDPVQFREDRDLGCNSPHFDCIWSAIKHASIYSGKEGLIPEYY